MTADGHGAEVRAAGGLVVRQAGDRPQLAVVHRPRYDDWSLPKGKLRPGEGFEEGALREVAEETGLSCEIAGELAPARYRDRKGRPKLVRYFLMHPLEGAFEPSDEVDEVRWLDVTEALAALTYQHDRDLVRGLQQASS